MTSDTPFTLTAADAVSGVALTEYRLDGGDWLPYEAPFALTGASGPRTVEFRSTDAAGNTEEPQAFEVILDNEAPTVAHAFDGPTHLRDGTTFLAPSTSIVLAATDSLSGVDVILYRIGDDAFIEYEAPIAFAGEDGPRALEYLAVDRLGNAADPVTVALHLDGTPPVTSLIVGEPSHEDDAGDVWVTQDTELTLASEDPPGGGDASGVAQTEYRLDDGPWGIYTGPFTLPEGHETATVAYRAADRLGNVEIAREAFFHIDDEAPEVEVVRPRPGSLTTSAGYIQPQAAGELLCSILAGLGVPPEPGCTDEPVIEEPAPVREIFERAYATQGSEVLFEVAAEDGGVNPVGVRDVTFFLDGEPVHVAATAPYEWGWDTGGVPPGEYVIGLVAADRLGHEASTSIIVSLLPTTVAIPPVP